jgi:hypothetical protein
MIGTENMIEVLLDNPDDFLKVRETLTRIGIASRKEQKLYQSCHILHKRGHYFIVHFKELFSLDGKPTDFSNEDKGRRNVIVKLLVEWGLIKTVNPIPTPISSISQVKIISFEEKKNWILVQKYNIGKGKRFVNP